MSFCLALAFQDERHWLELHLPRLLEAERIDGVIVLDGGSQDGGAEYLRGLGAWVYERPFDWNFAAHMNCLIACCEEAGFDSMLRVDPDELLWPEDIDAIARSLEYEKAVSLPTYHFERNRGYWMPQFYPDPHIRAWRLDRGPVRYSGTVHEWPEQDGEIIEAAPFQGHLYHYEGIRPHDKRRWLKHINYGRIKVGKAPLKELPAGLELTSGYRPHEAFWGRQPLDPREIGLQAPFKERE